MSATPRPWISGPTRNGMTGPTAAFFMWTGRYTNHEGGLITRPDAIVQGPEKYSEVVAKTYRPEDADLIVTAVNGFEALLAVAKEAWDHRDDACRKPHTALDVALAQIEAKHPGWREWSA